MKIKRIEYENFRNFRDRGEVRFAVDGKVTIIYGHNGDGKTTLHQLFQWIFYGQVHFNKTTTDRLYNLAFEKEAEYHSTFEVLGRIDFEHEGIDYSLTRVYTYKKESLDSSKIKEDLSLLAMDNDNNWNRVDNPQEMIEKMLPSGLADYFFFDGESMIADLRVKGKDSASKLRKALYSMFDLDILDAAIGHIGRTDLKNTVLGKLYLSKANVAGNSSIRNLETDIKMIQERMDQLSNKQQEYIKEKEEKNRLIQDISERIGGNKSKKEYEAQRQELKKQSDFYGEQANVSKAAFGDTVIELFPKLLISRTVSDSERIRNMKSSQAALPNGLSKRLIAYLTKVSTVNCICGRPMDDEHRKIIESYVQLMPPISHTETLQNFRIITEQWGNGYDREKVEKYIQQVISFREKAEKCDQEIKEIDDQEKNSPDIEQLIIDRQLSEARIRELDEKIAEINREIPKVALLLKKKRKEFDELTDAQDINQIVLRKIAIMERVREYFEDTLKEDSAIYSEKLQNNIQYLLEKMLTSKREVEVSSEFSVKVFDSHGDESKSEGQFAVVSFAYIGGILKMLKEEQTLSSKEYPLVLDGPFSKLDADQRQNVIDTIPEFAPQVILFSKDDLREYFDEKNVGRVWTIQSNDEKNIASIREGFLWN